MESPYVSGTKPLSEEDVQIFALLDKARKQYEPFLAACALPEQPEYAFPSRSDYTMTGTLSYCAVKQ